MDTALKLASAELGDTPLADLFADPAHLDREMRALCRRLPDFDSISALRWLVLMRSLGREEFVRDLVEGIVPDNVLVPYLDEARVWRTEDLARETERRVAPTPR